VPDRPTRRQLLQEAGLLAAGLWAAGRAGAAQEGTPNVTGDVAELWPMDPRHAGILAAAEESIRAGAVACAGDPYRPAFHFLPASRYLGDPNGLVQLDDGYHAFLQHFPYYGEPNGPMLPGWGHAVSTDLVHWARLPMALMPSPGTYDEAGIASGGCVLADEGPTIVYTSVPPQAQSLARSLDGGLTWAKCARNPVVSRPEGIPGLLDGFRDPFVWREGDGWLMLIGSGIETVGGTVLLYSSPDLLEWELRGPMCEGLGPDHFQWECPSFFPLGDHWVLVISPLVHSAPGLRAPVLYAVGDFDGSRFTHGEWRPVDLAGPDLFYAPNTLAARDGRRLLFGWALGGGAPGAPWQGMFTVPRELRLTDDLRLSSAPVAEVDSLRTRALADLGATELATDEPADLGTSREADLALDLAPGNEGCLRVEVLAGPTADGSPAVELDFAAGRLRFGATEGPLPPSLRDGGEVRILVDRSLVEVYAAGTTLTARAYPPPEQDRVRLRAQGAPGRLRSARLWQMESIW
jgi:beta-fructofuranosidase